MIHPWRHDRSQWIHVLDEMVDEHLDRSSGDHAATTGTNCSHELPVLCKCSTCMTKQSSSHQEHGLSSFQIVSASISCYSYLTLTTMVGVMEERGRFKGLTKLAGAGGGEFSDAFAGMEKSSISLLSRMPVRGERISEPKYALTVLVIETAFRSLSMMDKWLVPWS